MTIRPEYFALGGGLNLVTPPLSMRPGEMIDCINYECLAEGGYGRFKGYELFDGQDVAAQSLPGVNAVRGVHIYKGEVYAVRDDGANGKLYKATSSGWVAVTTPALSQEGVYRFDNYNFYAQDSAEEMFMVNGLDQCVKYDGTTAVSLATGSGATDAPTDVCGFKKHLFLAIESSVINSAIGDPTNWDAINGAAETATSDTVTEISRAPSSLIIGCQDSTHLLYGTSAANWQLEPFNDTGVIPRTTQFIAGRVLSLDDQGIFSMSASQAYGNFAYNTISKKIKPMLDALKGTVAPVSTVNRTKNQYRLFYGRQVIYGTFTGDKLSGFGIGSFPTDVTCVANGEDANGNEITVFGSSDGSVYQLDSSNYFNGEPMNSFQKLAFNHSQSPTVFKRYRMMNFDLKNEGAQNRFYVLPVTEYGQGIGGSAYQSKVIEPSNGGFWDYATWDNFVWDGQSFSDAKIRMNARGRNLSLLVFSDGVADSTHSIYGVSLHYSPRKLLR